MRAPRLNFEGNILEFARGGTLLEKVLSILLFAVGLGVLLLNGTGQWSDLTGFHQHWSGVALALYCMFSPIWSFMAHYVVIDRQKPTIDLSGGWSVFLIHRQLKRSQFSSISVITHDRSGFFKTDKLSHSIVVFGSGKPLFIHRMADYQLAIQFGRKLATWMRVRFNEDRKAQWTPFPWVYYYNSGALLVLCVLALWDWMS